MTESEMIMRCPDMVKVTPEIMMEIAKEKFDIEIDFNKILIYPVPALNEISLDFKELDDVFEYELFSIDGVVKDKGDVSINNPSINLERLASGEYFLILYTDKYFHKSKITKI